MLLLLNMVSDVVEIDECLMLLVDLEFVYELMVLGQILLETYTEEVHNDLSYLLTSSTINELGVSFERQVPIFSICQEVAHGHLVLLLWLKFVATNQDCLLVHSFSSWPAWIELKVDVRSLINLKKT